MTGKEKLLGVLTVATGLATGTLMQLEGYSSKPYLDSAGILTECYGNTHGVRRDVVKSKEQCNQLLSTEVGRIGAMLIKDQPNHTVPSLASGISFVYNIGDGAYRGSTYRKKLLQEDYVGACHEMSKWVYITKGGTKVKLQGLVNRRIQEVELCLSIL